MGFGETNKQQDGVRRCFANDFSLATTNQLSFQLPHRCRLLFRILELFAVFLKRYRTREEAIRNKKEEIEKKEEEGRGRKKGVSNNVERHASRAQPQADAIGKLHRKLCAFFVCIPSFPFSFLFSSPHSLASFQLEVFPGRHLVAPPAHRVLVGGARTSPAVLLCGSPGLPIGVERPLEPRPEGSPPQRFFLVHRSRGPGASAHLQQISLGLFGGFDVLQLHSA
eukprot:GHVT01042815.1.p1 GENE.GHVT01042815.1~~GHVT01042815.1.p1  ORF type:complete len:224 (-),score=38.06 GHVT01042815.1:270-941(-)